MRSTGCLRGFVFVCNPPPGLHGRSSRVPVPMFGFLRKPMPTSGVEPRATRAKLACFHCGLPVPQPVIDSVDFAGRARPMCCAACAAAAGFLIASGMAAEYYRDRLESAA